MSNARESISDFDASEKKALAKLVRLMARADGDLSSEERAKIDRIAIDAGGDSFWAMLDDAAASNDDQEAILKQVATVGTSDAREIIYGLLYELSIADAGGKGENELLDALASCWDLAIGDDASDGSSDE